jgi:heme/copper-type cytochrome/quinol oxidase subunit 3
MLSPVIGVAGAVLLMISSLLFSRVSTASLFAAMAYLALLVIQWHQLGATLLQNNFFGSYLLMSAMHGLHLIGGIIGLLFFLLFRQGKLPVAFRNYWHFVNLLGLFALAALYFV